VKRRARYPLVLDHVRTSDDETIEAEASWLEQWHEQDIRTWQDSNAALPARDRAATTARPLRNDGDEHPDDLDDFDAGRITLIDIQRSPQAVGALRLMESLRSASHRSLTALGVGRTLLLVLMLYYALSSGVQLVGGHAFPLAPFPWAASSGAASADAALPPLRMDGKVATRVQPMTQMRRVDLYDSKAQFDRWAGSACSAASLAEILAAYGLPHMTIGRMIRELGPDISPQWGLLTYYAFNKVVAKYGLRADVYLEHNPLTYKQMLYLTNTLGIPVTINMRATSGYYRYLSGGHILVMTGGDARTIHLADSSLYYMKSLPLSVYNQMARSRNVVIVPKDYHYTLPR
jgi:hypothetical protein